MSAAFPPYLEAMLERLLPDELFEGVMLDMDATWLRERAETIAASGEPEANVKAAALLEAADALEASAGATAASAEAAPQ